jgi:quinol monooxygenase YgiN
MGIKILVERRVLPGQERRALELMRQIRARCLDEPGYISGETLRDSEDPNTILVMSSWFGLGDWRRWHQSETRRAFESQMRPLLAAPERVRVLLEGLTETHSGA